jgi:hypothetical protein
MYLPLLNSVGRNNWFWIIFSKAGPQMGRGYLNASTDPVNVKETKSRLVFFHCTKTMLQFMSGSSAVLWAPGSHPGLDHRSEHMALSVRLYLWVSLNYQHECFKGRTESRTNIQLMNVAVCCFARCWLQSDSGLRWRNTRRRTAGSNG